MNDNNVEIRRKDREVKDVELYKSILRNMPMCSIALTNPNGFPYVNSNLFFYDESQDELYFHTAFQGHTRKLIEKNNQVCISISKMGRVYPAERAFDFGAEYSSVTLYGTVEIIRNETEQLQFFNRFIEKYFPHLTIQDYIPPTSNEIGRATVYKVKISDWTAKKYQVEKDRPGAIYYDDYLC